jgi:hypothetical protein
MKIKMQGLEFEGTLEEWFELFKETNYGGLSIPVGLLSI